MNSHIIKNTKMDTKNNKYLKIKKEREREREREFKIYIMVCVF